MSKSFFATNFLCVVSYLYLETGFDGFNVTLYFFQCSAIVENFLIEKSVRFSKGVFLCEKTKLGQFITIAIVEQNIEDSDYL